LCKVDPCGLLSMAETFVVTLESSITFNVNELAARRGLAVMSLIRARNVTARRPSGGILEMSKTQKTHREPKMRSAAPRRAEKLNENGNSMSSAFLCLFVADAALLVEMEI
jgi:hypothetical protein